MAGSKVGDMSAPVVKTVRSLPTTLHATYDLYDFLSLDNVTGLIVLKDGAVVFETYQRGNTADTRWTI